MTMLSPQDFGAALYRILPAVYRTRDSGDLRAYLAACGELLDAVYDTLVQRYADNFPDNPPADSGLPPCQEWLLPYFAQLLDAQLYSPLVRGKRDELAQAIRWRQGKGTLSVIEAVVEAVAQTEAVVQEGWQRLAVTPRLRRPLQPAVALGYSREPHPTNPGNRARHPDLPAVTVDLRCPSRAVPTDPANAAAQSVTIESVRHLWRQASVHGAPCFPGSYQDVSARSLDLRAPDWRRGHFHPRRVLVYLPPPSGYFPPGLPTVSWSETPSERFLELIEVTTEGERTTFRNRTLDTAAFRPVRINRPIELGPPPGFLGAPDIHTWRFAGVVINSSVEANGGRIELDRCAVRNLVSHSVDTAQPVVSAEDCLIRDLQAARGLSRLVHCTVLEQCLTERILASDCLFLDILRKDRTSLAPPDAGCVRYSRVVPHQQVGGVRWVATTRQHASLIEASFGARHCGVLHPASGPRVRFGAEDGGELGAYHHRFHTLIERAVGEKLRDHLPLGQEAVLIPDPLLLRAPVA